MDKDKELEVLDNGLEQLEEQLELNIESKQPEEADEMIELIDIDEEEYDDFSEVEFIHQDEKKNKKKKSSGKVIYHVFRTVVMMIALVAFGYASYELTLVYLENDTSYATKDEIANMFLQDAEDINSGGPIYNSEGETIVMENSSNGKAFVWDYQKMLDYNSEAVGYIRQDNGDYIDYPILQHSDNDYYLYHLPDHKWSSMGSIFMDYRIEGGLNADYSIVYGHYIGKRANNIMFGSLNWYWDRPSYHVEHPDFDIYVEDRHYKYYVFSIMKVPAAGHEVYNPNFESDEARLEFMKEVKAQSRYEFTEAPELTTESKIVMLSTCTQDKTVRFVMFLVRGEEIYDVPGVDYDNLPEDDTPDETTPEESTDETSGEDDTSTEDDSTTKDDVTSDSEETTTKKEETSSNKEETTTKKQETSSDKDETTTKKEETSSNKEETTTKKEDSTTKKNESTSSSEESSSGETTSKEDETPEDPGTSEQPSESDSSEEETTEPDSSQEETTEPDSSQEQTTPEESSDTSSEASSEETSSEESTTPME